MAEQIAIVQDYDTLQFSLREWADKLGLSRIELDERANLQPGYSAKLLALTPSRRLGPDTIGPLLKALGLVLILAPVDAELKRLSDSGVKRREDCVRARPLGKAEKDACILELMQKIGRRGGRH